MFRRFFVLYKREVKELFLSPLVYIITAFFMAIVGWVFFNYIINTKELTGLTLTSSVLNPTLGIMNSLNMFFAPVITMNTFAGEKRNFTLDLLLRSKLGTTEIIMAKLMSSLSISLLMMSLTLIFPLILSFSGFNAWGTVFTGYLGLLFITTCYLIVGIFSSSLTDNLIVSVFTSFSLLLGFMLFPLVSNSSNNYIVGQIFEYITLGTHFNSFTRGMITSYSFVFYFSFIFFFIYLTKQVINSRKW